MATENEEESPLYIDMVDGDTRNNILSMNQKLKGLRAEIMAKIEDNDNVDENTLVLEGVDYVLNEIKMLTTLVADGDETERQNYLQSESFQEFSQELARNLEELKVLKEKL